MVEPLRHRQTKGAETDMPGLPPPRHIPTLPDLAVARARRQGPVRGHEDQFRPLRLSARYRLRVKSLATATPFSRPIAALTHFRCRYARFGGQADQGACPWY